MYKRQTLTGTLSTTAQPNISSVGTLSGLVVSGIANITGTTNSTSTTSGALQVSGGAGIGGNVNVGGNIVTNTVNIGNISGIIPSLGNVFTGTPANVLASNIGIYTTSNELILGATSSGGYGNVFLRIQNYGDQNGPIIDVTQSSANYVGDLVFRAIGGGIAQQRNIRFNATGGTVNGSDHYELQFGQVHGGYPALTVANNAVAIGWGLNTTSTSTTSGALQVSGGVGIQGNLYVGGITNIPNTTASTNTTSGALVVAGGAGIGGNLYVGGIANITGNATVGNLSTSGTITGGNLSTSGTISGATLSGYSEQYYTVTISSSGYTPNWSNGQTQKWTISNGYTPTLFAPSAPGGSAKKITVFITTSSSGTVWVSTPGLIKWPGGVTPTITSNGTDLYELYCPDGTTWYGRVVAQNLS